jgi:murein DD-endopeptidase MepM/ murein hydrolase activator NlpD
VKKNILWLIIILVIVGLSLKYQEKPDNKLETMPVVERKEIIKETYPIAEFRQRITKKTFGKYITVENSPVSPERFKGFHTGIDVEYEDVVGEVPVLAVCDGEIVLSKWVSGYGGVLILKCAENYYIYGHLKDSSITKNLNVLRGEQIGILGEGQTQETDFERKHLHFGINKKSADLRGYVQNERELENWIDPLEWGIYYE